METRRFPISPGQVLSWFLSKNDLEEGNLFAATIKYLIIIKNKLYLNLFMWLKTRTQIHCKDFADFFKIGVLKNFDFIKKRFQDRCLVVKSAKFLWTPFFTGGFLQVEPSVTRPVNNCF